VFLILLGIGGEDSAAYLGKRSNLLNFSSSTMIILTGLGYERS
jgi:hypothetical protein